MLDIVEDGIIVFDRNRFIRSVLDEIASKLGELGSRRIRTSK
ncbi:MAG: hypothetical protein QW756_04280 [Nitrososphaerota archaeon]